MLVILLMIFKIKVEVKEMIILKECRMCTVMCLVFLFREITRYLIVGCFLTIDSECPTSWAHRNMLKQGIIFIVLIKVGRIL